MNYALKEELQSRQQPEVGWGLDVKRHSLRGRALSLDIPFHKTWEAKTTGGQPVSSSGAYTFREELSGHVLARHSTRNAGCKGPSDFDCDHTDLLYAWQTFPHGPVSAIYFDNEGHVIHYSVSTPDANTAIFLSDPNQPGPLFRLIYERKGDTMSGRFQMQMPGHSDWNSYLEWTGTKLPEKKPQ